MQILLAANRAVAEDVGLLATLLGIGILVNVILVYLAVQLRGEYLQNRRRHDISRDVEV